MIQVGPIIVRNLHDNIDIEFPKQVDRFSVILSTQLGNNTTIIDIPADVGIQSSTIKQIRMFLQIHEYNPKKVITPQVSQTTKPYSTLCTSQTKKFITDHLAVKSDEQVRKLWAASNYLKLQLLNRVISLHVLQKYGLPFDDKSVKEILKKYGEQNYGDQNSLQQEKDENGKETEQSKKNKERNSMIKKQRKRKQQQQMKIRYTAYFKSYGTKLLMEIQSRNN